MATSAILEAKPRERRLSRRERRKRELRARILEAARALFGERGVDATKVLEICELADVAHKTFFNYFPTKRHVLRELAQDSIEKLLEDLEQARREGGSSAGRIRAFFARVAANAAEAGPMQRELLTELVHVAHEAGTESEQARLLHDAFASIVAEGRREGDLDARHSDETLTEIWMGAFYGLMFNWANLEDYPLGERAAATAEFLVASMTAPGGASAAPPPATKG